jgi:hypothetical protein
MIVLMRMFPKETGNAEDIWKCLNERFQPDRIKKVTPLFVSMQTRARFVSLFLETDDPEKIGDVLVNEIGACNDIVDTRTIPLLKMAFLPTPKIKPKNLKRFSVMISCQPKNYYSIYRDILDLKPVLDTFAGFAAFLIGDFDVMVSILSTSQRKVKEYVARNIWKMEGVEDVKIFPIQKSKLLISEVDWLLFQRALLYVPPWVTDEVRDTLEFGFHLSEGAYTLQGS